MCPNCYARGRSPALALGGDAADEVCNALRWLVRAEAPWRMPPNHLPICRSQRRSSSRAGVGWMLVASTRWCRTCAHHPRDAGPPAPVPRRGDGQANAAVELRERSICRLRRLQTKARQQGAYGGRHAGLGG